MGYEPPSKDEEWPKSGGSELAGHEVGVIWVRVLCRARELQRVIPNDPWDELNLAGICSCLISFLLLA